MTRGSDHRFRRSSTNIERITLISRRLNNSKFFVPSQTKTRQPMYLLLLLSYLAKNIFHNFTKVHHIAYNKVQPNSSK